MRKQSRYLIFLLDVLIIVFSFLVIAKFKTGTRAIIADYWRSLIPFILVWIGSGIWGEKFAFTEMEGGAVLVRRILKSDALATLALLILMFVFKKFHYSRSIVLGTITGVVGIELFLFIGIYYTFRFHRENKPFAATGLVTRSKEMEDLQAPKFFLDAERQHLPIPSISDEEYIPPFAQTIPEDSIMVPLFQDYLKDERELLEFINDFIEINRFRKDKSLILDSETFFNIENEPEKSKQLFINLHKINDFRRVNRYFIRVNEMLDDGGVFICRGQTITQRRKSFYKRYTPYFGIFLYSGDFLFRRVMPKLPILQGWYFALTKGKNRALSETEILGRLYFCGFDLIHKREIDGRMHFILKKSREPRTDPNPTYGPLIRLKRRGKDGKVIYVKKFRTMHPYSEYLQSYVYETQSLQEGGKFKDDFRVTSWGRVMRKLWIDELPQFINFFAGELSLVGVRALSEQYFAMYPDDVKELRLQYKPGLLPPFYADMPKSFDEIVESERQYLLRKEQKPIRTDWAYFWKSVYNILIRKARSN
ncbi:MAG: sugar transferase [Candidatus Cloacimonadaceae bacterium]